MSSLYDTFTFKIVIFFLLLLFLRACYEHFEALLKHPALFGLRCI